MVCTMAGITGDFIRTTSVRIWRFLVTARRSVRIVGGGSSICRPVGRIIAKFRLSRFVRFNGVRLTGQFWSGAASRLKVFRELSAWLGISEHNLLKTLSLPLPLVMATKDPRPGRWRDNAKILGRVINDAAIRSLATTLGYKDKSQWL